MWESTYGDSGIDVHCVRLVLNCSAYVAHFEICFASLEEFGHRECGALFRSFSVRLREQRWGNGRGCSKGRWFGGE